MKEIILAVSISLLMSQSAHAGLLSSTLNELTVKGGELQSCPNVTMEQQADSFFKDPEWSSLEASDGRQLVNLSGTFTFKNRPVRGLLQMWIQDDSFSMEALEINGQPQPEVMIDALLSKMCEAAKANATMVSREEQELPFIGKRNFNFEGGSGTNEYITIHSNGQVVLESCGASNALNDFQAICSVDWEGIFTNPLKTKYGTYRVDADRIYELSDNGQRKTCPEDGGDSRDKNCSVGLYEVNQ